MLQPTGPHMNSAKLIVIIDDDPIVGHVISDILDQAGHRTRTFTEPRAALDHVLADHEAIRMVISDNDMPEMHGTELLQEIRSRHPGLPLLLVSARPPASMPPGLNFLAKPFRIETLLQCVTDTLSGRITRVGSQGASEAA